MRLRVSLFAVFLTAAEAVFAQSPRDPSFSLLLNNTINFSHAGDPHINRWLAKYGYPAEPHVPVSYQFELAAIPVSSRFMYSLKVSTIVSAKNLTSFNILGGVYEAIVKRGSLLIFGGVGAGYHSDIITLNGDMPPDYKELANQYKKQLSLHRDGLFIEPALRAYWFPVRIHSLQVGLFASLGYDLDLNSRWKLGYYENADGSYSRFKKIRKPADQQKVSEYGVAYNAGISFRLSLH